MSTKIQTNAIGAGATSVDEENALGPTDTNNIYQHVYVSGEMLPVPMSGPPIIRTDFLEWNEEKKSWVKSSLPVHSSVCSCLGCEIERKDANNMAGAEPSVARSTTYYGDGEDDSTPTIQELVNNKGVSIIPSNETEEYLKYGLPKLENAGWQYQEHDKPLPLHPTYSGSGWEYWTQLPNGKFLWDPRWEPGEPAEEHQ
jgi:hypothetical protein